MTPEEKSAAWEAVCKATQSDPNNSMTRLVIDDHDAVGRMRAEFFRQLDAAENRGLAYALSKVREEADKFYEWNYERTILQRLADRLSPETK